VLPFFERKLHLIRVFNTNSLLPNDRPVQNSPARALDNVNGSHIGNRLARALIDVSRRFCACPAKLANEEEATAKDVLQQFLSRHCPLPALTIAKTPALSGSGNRDQALMISISSKLCRSFCESICESAAVSS
jgi:hypothetical protein